MPWGSRERIPWEVRFWSKVDKSPGQGPNGDCWLWKGGNRGSRVSSLSNTFYGGFRNNEGKIVLAHRVSYALAHGAIPAAVSILHTCDTPACVRVEHLFEGNQLQNMRDCWKKGRGYIPRTNHQRVRGEASGKSKLTAEAVVEIRSLYEQDMSKVEIARKFGVTSQNIVLIVSRRTWNHV